MSDHLSKKIHSTLSAETTDFTELVEFAELDPAIDFSNTDLSDANFQRCDLSDFDFRGSNLTNASFLGTRLSSVLLDNDVPLQQLENARDFAEYLKRQTEQSASNIANCGIGTVKVGYEQGIHARPSAKIVELLSNHPEHECYMIYNDLTARCDSIMGLLMCEAPKDANVDFFATGPNAKEVLDELLSMVKKGDN